MAQALGYDLTSRESLLKACRAAGLHGFLLSNLIFLRPHPDEGEVKYRRQIDHVLVTEGMIVLVENKSWKGVVFDGVLPSELFADLEVLTDESQLGRAFAVQIGGNEQGVRVSEPVPVQQAIAQVRDLKDLMGEHGLPTQRVEVCVYYSHPEVRLHATPSQTAWRVRVVDTSQLDDVLVSSAFSEKYPVQDIMEALSPYTGDTVGLGRFEAHRPALF